MVTDASIKLKTLPCLGPSRPSSQPSRRSGTLSFTAWQLPSYLRALDGEASSAPMQQCDVPLIVDHFIIHCLKFSRYRTKKFGAGSTLKSIFSIFSGQ